MTKKKAKMTAYQIALLSKDWHQTTRQYYIDTIGHPPTAGQMLLAERDRKALLKPPKPKKRRKRNYRKASQSKRNFQASNYLKPLSHLLGDEPDDQ